LHKLGIAWVQVSRNEGGQKAITYDQLTPSLIKSHLLIINTTPLGTYPKVETAPEIPYSALTSDHLLYDLVYNPPETRFLAYGC
jgi:shikimate dehydrogenase